MRDHSMTTPPPTPKPRRRWLQFSLRTKLVWAWLLRGFGSVVLFGTMLYAPTARWWTRRSGEHLTLAEARGKSTSICPMGQRTFASTSTCNRMKLSLWILRLPRTSSWSGPRGKDGNRTRSSGVCRFGPGRRLVIGRPGSPSRMGTDTTHFGVVSLTRFR